MARLNKDLVKQRESEALDAFKKGATVKQVNDALFLKHGKRMGLKRIYELKVAATEVSSMLIRFTHSTNSIGNN